MASLTSFSQRNLEIGFKERLADSVDTKFDSILIVGVGSSTTRLFLDDLSDCMIKDLAPKPVNAKFFYLGKTVAEAKRSFDTLNKKGYKAILFFMPKGESIFDVHGEMTTTSTNSRVGPISLTTASAGIYYYQYFDVHLYINEAAMKKVWSAWLEVSGDISKVKQVKKAARKVLNKFEKNGYVKE